MQFTKEQVKNSVKITGEYFTAKYVFGYLGYLFARVLVKTRITPNQLTWFWGGLLAASSILFIFDNWYLNVIGGIGWIVGYSLDYTDGGLARMKKIYSKRGMFLDYVNHVVTYFLLMVCIGIGVYNSGGCPYFDILPDWIYLAFGLGASLGINLIHLMPVLYTKACDSKHSGRCDDIEGSLTKNGRLFKIIMNLNPLTFTNMMALIVIFALLNQMWLFILVYGLGYSAAAFARFILMYKSIPARVEN